MIFLRLVTYLFVVMLVQCGASSHAPVESKIEDLDITSIYWSDGDSGRLNGNVKFRLSNVDAPETGGVGAIGGAKCEAERVIGFEAKSFMVGTTKSAQRLEVRKSYGLDKYERAVIELFVDERNIGELAIKAGHLRAWPHKGRRSLIKKPIWCDTANINREKEKL